MMHRRVAGALLAAVLAGLASPYLLMAGHVCLSSLIEPTARMSRFLASSGPHHPLQLAAAAWFVCIAGGFCAGLALRLLTTWAKPGHASLLWLSFMGGFGFSLLLLAAELRLETVPPLLWWAHVTAFVIASAMSRQWHAALRAATHVR